MADLLALSARIIDSGTADEPVNRISQELSQITDGIAVVESFSHSIVFDAGDSLLVFDASGSATGARVVEAVRHWSSAPVHTVVYTHGHLDHVGGSPAFIADASARGFARPSFVGHSAVVERMARYRLTDAWNRLINERQFGWVPNRDLRIGAGDLSGGGSGSGSGSGLFGDRFLPDDVAAPDITYDETLGLKVGELDVELHHGKGETDDHTWAWIPSARAICCGDFLIWNFPNAGNPQKVQRYPAEWAASLRAMAALQPELLLPSHGLPIGGADRIRSVLLDVAGVLEDLVSTSVELMNDGASLDEIIHNVRVPDETLARPYLRPLYDEPEFVIRNIWRQYGGWWDANPARLKPPPDADLAAEVAGMVGGVALLVKRAEELAGSGRLDLACQVVEWAAQASPGDPSVHRARAEIYMHRHRSESSLMAKGIFASAARESESKA